MRILVSCLVGIVFFVVGAGVALAVNCGSSTNVPLRTDHNGMMCITFRYVWMGDCGWVNAQGDPADLQSPPQSGANVHEEGEVVSYVVYTVPSVSVVDCGEGQCTKAYSYEFCFNPALPSGSTVTMPWLPWTNPNTGLPVQPPPSTYTVP